MTLKQLIKKLFKQHNLSPAKHFDVWICRYRPDCVHDTLDKENPLFCCHFTGFKKYVDMQGNRKIQTTKDGHHILDGSDVFKWLEFGVEDYEFEIPTNCGEYWLFVKLDDIGDMQ